MIVHRPRLRRAGLACILAAAVLLSAGCSKNRQEKDDTLRIYSRLWAPLREQSFIRDTVLDRYSMENGRAVELSLYTDNDLTAFAEADNLAEADLVIPYGKDLPFWIEQVELYDIVGAAEGWSERSFITEIDPWQSGAFSDYFLPIGADVYVFLADARAEQYRPAGAGDELSWREAVDWILAASEGEGRGLFALTGVPRKSLIYAVSGVILSYGGGFPDLGSPEARVALELLNSLRAGVYADIRSLDTVIEPLVAGDAWFAFAHCARVGAILQDSDRDFLLFQAPAGPAGRGSVGGVSGLGIPAAARDPEGALSLAEYLTRPEVQVVVSRGVGGFIPTVEEAQGFLDQTPLDRLIRSGLNLLKEGRIRGIPSYYAEWGNVKQVYEELFLNHVFSDESLDQERLDQAVRDLAYLKQGGS